MADTTPPQGATNPQFNQYLQDILETQKVSNANMKEMLDLMNATNSPAAKLKEEMDKIQLSIRAIVDFAGDWKETLGEVLGISKKMSQGGIYDSKTYGQATRRLQEMLDMHKQLAHRTGLTGEQQKILTKLVEGTSKSMTELQRRAKMAHKSMDDALDSDAIVAVSREMRGYVHLVEKLASGFKKVDIGPLTSASKTMSEMMGKQGRLHQIIATAERLKGTKEGVHNRIHENVGRFHAHTGERKYGVTHVTDARDNKNIKTRTSAFSGRHIPNTRAGYEALSPLQKRMAHKVASASQSNLQNEVDELAPKRPSLSNWVDRKMASKILNARNTAAMGGDAMGSGIVGEKGLSWMAKGGGSFTKGMSLAGEEGLAGLGSAAGDLLGMGALPMAAVGGVAEGVNALFNATTERNKGVYGALGNAGIFNGNRTGQRSFQNVRSNLTPTGGNAFFDPLGITYEKNLKIAGAIANSGVDMSELARGGNGLVSNSVGRVGRTAYQGAALAGLDETKGTEQIMKLLQQYHQSLDSTDKFFDKLNKDTHAAGITTTKYLQIIDSVTSSFDAMAKSLDTVTGVMRVLGSTGTQTADSIENTMKTLAGGGDKSPEQKAFIATEMMSNPSIINHMVGARETQVSKQADVVRSALTDSKLFSPEEIAKMDLTSGAGIQAARAMLNTRANEVGPDGRSALTLQTAGGAFDELQTRHSRLAQMKQFAGDKSGEGAVNYAFGSDLVPQDYFGKSMETITSMMSSGKMGGASFGDIMATGGDALSKNSALTSLLAKQQGLDPATFQKMVTGVSGAASQYAHLAKQGNSNITDEEYQKMAKVMGLGQLTGAKAKAKIMGLDETGVTKLTLAMSKDSETLLDMVDSSSSLQKALEENASKVDKEAQKKRAEEVAISQRPTAQIFADAFSNLFNTISKPLTTIMDLIEGWLGSSDKASGDQIGQLQKLLTGDGKGNIAGDLTKMSGTSSALLKYADQLQDTIDNETDDKKKAQEIELQKKLTDAAENLSQSVNQTSDYQERLNRGDMSAKDAEAMRKQLLADQQMAATGGGVAKVNPDGSVSLTGDADNQFKALTSNPMEGANASAVKPAAGTPAAATAAPAKSGDTYHVNGVVYKVAKKSGDTVRTSDEQSNSDPNGTSDVVQGGSN
jgi:hypothetical protein